MGRHRRPGKELAVIEKPQSLQVVLATVDEPLGLFARAIAYIKSWFSSGDTVEACAWCGHSEDLTTLGDASSYAEPLFFCIDTTECFRRYHESRTL